MGGEERTLAVPAELLQAARLGDHRAQARIFALHRRAVAAQIQRMTGDSSVVDDLLQEVFISAFAALPDFRGESRVSTWLYRIAANKVRNHWDTRRRREARERVASTLPAGCPVDPDEEIAQAEHRARLYAALGQLPHKLREAFVARAIEGMSLQEASEVLDVPVSTVSYRARSAESRLCALLGIDPEEAGA